MQLRDFSVIASPVASGIQFRGSPTGQECAELVQLGKLGATFFRRAMSSRDFPFPKRLTARNQKPFAIARWASC